MATKPWTPPAKDAAWAPPQTDLAQASGRDPSLTAKKEEPGVLDWLGQVKDRAGLALGLIDPKTYYGPDGPRENELPSVGVRQRPWFERASDAFAQEAGVGGRGEIGFVGRRILDAMDVDDADLAAQYPGSTPEQREAYRDRMMAERAKELRLQGELQHQADPNIREGDSWYSPGSIGRFLAELGGGTIANANPTYAISGGSGPLARMMVQGGVNAGIDAVVQGGELSEGIRDGFDPLQTGGQFVAGSLMQGGGEALGYMARRLRGRGEVAAPDEVLQDATLDGGVAPDGPIDVDATLQSVGLRPDQFSSPEIAAAMAERINQARGRPLNVDAATMRERADIQSAIETGEMHPSYAPPPLESRVVPDNVVMQAYPEGTVRGDEVGSIVGLMRNLAANQNVVDQATARAADNPTLRAILDAQVDTQKKIGPMWEILQRMTTEPAPPRGPLAFDRSTELPPHLRPTVEQARGVTEGIVLPVQGPISSRFGGRKAPTAGASTNHRGIDIAAERGSPVAAPEGGTVIMAGEAGPNGNLVRVDHGNGVVTSYAHLDSINVRMGQQIGKGEQLGTVGSTGRSTGPHLHYQVAENGKQVDPETFRFGQRPAEEDVYRAPAREDDIFDTGGSFERRTAQSSPNMGERERGEYFESEPGIFTGKRRGGRPYDFPMESGDSSRPFKDVRAADDRPEARGPMGAGPPPEGTPPRRGTSYWEDRAEQMADDLMREYEASQAKRRERASSQGARQEDPSERFKKYGQKPHQGENGFWNMTDDGIVADANGNPVAFRNAKEAAKWATKNQMAGDFELHSWGTNSARVVLRRRGNSTYGQAKPEAAGPVGETAEEAASGAQRQIGGPRNEAPRQGEGTPEERAAAVYRDLAENGSPKPGAPIKESQWRGQMQEQAENPGRYDRVEEFDNEYGYRIGDRVTIDGEEQGRIVGMSSRGDFKVQPDGTYGGWYAGDRLARAEGETGRKPAVNGPIKKGDVVGRHDLRRPPEETPSAEAMARIKEMRKENKLGAMVDKKTPEDQAREYALGYDAGLRGEPVGGDYENHVLWQHGHRSGKIDREKKSRPSRKPLTGKKQTVVTPAGREVETQFEVRELRDLKQATGVRQPRDRSRDASDVQVNDIAAKLDPDQLRGNRQAAHGSPIIGPDGVIEVGNGRARALERAYSQHPDRIEAYQQMIRDEGFDVSGFDQPVLVRRRLGEMSDDDMRAWVNEAQESGTMRYSAPEQARADAGALSDETLQLYRGGEIDSAANREFVKAWSQDTKADANALRASDGSLSAEGRNRVRASILAKAFDDETLIAKLLGDADNNIKAIGNVLLDAAPKFAQVRAMAKEGRIGREFDLSAKVAEMAGIISKARSEGHIIPDLLSQNDMFGKNVDAATESLVRLMFKDDGLTVPRNQARLKDGFDFYLEGAMKTEDGAGMFGDALRPVDILEAARAHLVAKDVAAKQGKLYRLDDTGGKKAGRAGSDLAALDQQLGRIVDSADDVAQRELAQRLLDIEDVPIKVREEPGFGEKFGAPQAVGAMSFPDRRIYIDDIADTETLLHEAVHARLMRRYGYEFSALRPSDLGAGPAMDMVRLYNDARMRWKRYGFWNRAAAGSRVEYAMKNVDEFIAMALTNKEVQQWLQRGTLWERLVDGFRKVLGLPARLKPVLDDVLRAGRGLTDAARVDPVRTIGFTESGIAYNMVNKDGFMRDAKALKEAVGKPGKTVKKLGDAVKDGVSWLMFSNDARGRMVADRIESKAAHEMLDKFFARPGLHDGKTTERTYHEAVQRFGNGRSQEAFRALEGIIGKPAKERRVADLLRYPNRTIKATAEELEAAKKLRQLLKDTIEYRKAAGEEIGEVHDGYFPRWIDVERVMARQDDFVEAATRLYRNIGDSAQVARESAQRWMERIVDTYAGLDAGLDLQNVAGDTVGARTAKAREFGKEADKLLADFYQDNVLEVMAQYFHGSARRAEMARRFGPKGAVNSKERAAWMKKHGKKTQLEVLEDRIREDARAHGEIGAGAMGVLRGIYSSNLGRLSGGMSNKMRQTVAWAHTWTQLGVMDRAVLTSLAELAAGFTRGGMRHGIPFVAQSMKQYVRQLRRAAPDDAQRWSEALGVAQDAIVNEALTARASIEGGTQKSQSVLAAFYQATTLHQYTEATRIASVKMARELLRQWSHDMASKSARVSTRAKKFLAEAGIRNPDEFAKKIREGGFMLDDVSRETSADAADYGTAVVRIANQAIMRPTRAEKPSWATHPVGSMFFSLMSYSYGFKKNVLDRAGRLAVKAFKDKDPTLLMPAMGLAIMTAWQGINDTYVRPAIFGGGPPEDEPAPQAALRVADRAGLTGGLSPIVNALTGVRYRRSLSESLAGPVIGRPLDMGTKLVELAVNNSEKTNTAERAAAGAVYDNILEPGMDAFAATRLGGPLRTGAVLGTGTRDDKGLLPADREAFIEAVAGPKKKKKGG